MSELNDGKKETRRTHQKELITECLKDCDGEHLTAEEIYDRIRDRDQRISIATVYRNLRLLEEQGAVEKVCVDDDSQAYYELSADDLPHSHHHLVCRNCGGIFDFQPDLLDSLEHMIEETEDFSIADHRVIFYGTCSQCKKKAREAKNAQAK
jgi:Fur family ferric uptake transcriptional regulator